MQYYNWLGLHQSLYQLQTILGGAIHYVSTVTEQLTPIQERKTALKPLNKNMRMTPQYKTENKHAQKIENKMKNKTHMSIIKINNVCARTRIN